MLNLCTGLKPTQGTLLFLHNCPPKNPMRENRCSSSEGFIIMQISYVQLGCKIGSPNRDFYMVVIHLLESRYLASQH